MNKIKGNLLTLADNGMFNVIAHGCNCFNVMGSGIAPQIKARWPEVFIADTEAHEDLKPYNNQRLLGGYSNTNVETKSEQNMVVYNLYTQYNTGTPRAVNYAALGSAFLLMFNSLEVNSVIGIPQIGAGLGGGDWSIIEQIIDDANQLTNHTIVLVEYDRAE